MLPLPKNLKIDRDYTEENNLLAKAKTYLESQDRAEGIHASDLMDPRISFLKRRYKQGVPDRLVNMFVVGQLAHAIIEVIHAGGDKYTTKSDSGTRFYKDLAYSPDMFDLDGNPDEVKTTRSFYLPDLAYLPNDETYHRYLEQLMIYMAAEDKIIGRLTLLYLNSKGDDGRTQPQFYIFKIETTPEALTAYRRVIDLNKELLSKAITDNDLSILPLCRAYMCKNCEWFASDCKPPGRYGVPEKEWLKQTKVEKDREAISLKKVRQ